MAYNHFWSRLDYFLVSKEWESYFSVVVHCTLPRPLLDHSPFLLDESGISKGSTPFRFGNIWLKEEGFKDFLKWWSLWYNLRGSYSFILAVKLKALKSNLKSWNKKVFGNVVVRKDMTFNQVGF